MKVRILSGVVGILLLIPVLIFSGTIVLPIVMALLSALAAYEMCACIGVKEKWHLVVPAMVYAFLMPLLTVWLLTTVSAFAALYATVSFVFLFYVLAASVIRGGREPFSMAAELSLGVIYATAGFTAIAVIRAIEGGAYLFALVFISAWITDTMAYFTGYFFGKHKLCPAISPKKTVEGSVGGTLFCALFFLLYGLITQLAFGQTPNYPMLAVVGVLLSVVSQLGDLIASLIKREHGVKDYGHIMPGHGGIMDRFDSIVAVAPFLLILTEASAAFTLFM